MTLVMGSAALTHVALHNPRTGERVGDYAPGRVAEIERAVHTAHGARSAWWALTPGERSRRMMRWARALSHATADLAKLEAQQRGIPLPQAQEEVAAAIDVIEFYAAAGRMGQTPAAGRWITGYHSRVSQRPLGVVGAILPWNYPMLMLAWRVSPALAAANAVIVKPAEETPAAITLAVKLAVEPLGAGVLSTVVGDRETGRLLGAAGLDGYAFTGSRAAGRDLQAAAAPAPVYLELGGNCPALFMDDAPDDAARLLIEAAFHNGGQSCAAPSRIITESAAGTERILEAVRASTAATPLISKAAVERTRSRIRDAARFTQNVAWQRELPGENGGFFQTGTAVVLGPGAQTELRVLETFAPVVTVEQATGRDHALGLALDPTCGNDLAASIWTRDLDWAHHAAYVLSLHVGEIWINCHLKQTPELPHSGGGGVDLSLAAVEQYRRPTTVTTRMHVPARSRS